MTADCEEREAPIGGPAHCHMGLSDIIHYGCMGDTVVYIKL